MGGRYYWESTDGKSAIWYHPSYKEWMVGSIFYLGTQFRGISAGLTSVTCPNQNHHRWVFWNGIHWLTDKKQQIHLFCTEDYANVDLNKAAIGKVAIGHKKPFKNLFHQCIKKMVLSKGNQATIYQMQISKQR